MRWKLGFKTVVPALGIAALVFGATAASAATLTIQSTEGEGPIVGSPGATITIKAVIVSSQGEEVAGLDNTIEFTDSANITGCTVNDAIDKGATAFEPGDNSIRALVLSLTNVCAICDIDQCPKKTEPGYPDPATQCSDEGLPVKVYTCAVEISASAQPGDTFPLTCTNSLGSDPDGNELPLPCASAEIVIPNVTATPTPTETLVPPTDTPTSTPTNTRVPGGDEDDDGCQVVAPASGKSGWLLLLPVGVLLWVRRRSR